MKTLIVLFLISVAEYTYCQNYPTDDTKIIEEILEVNRAMESDFNRGAYSKIGTYYAQDGVMVGNKVEVIGQGNLIAYWGKFDNAQKWVLENTQITILGPDAALQRGYSNIYYYKDSELAVSRSIFSLVWIKTEEGWKILLDHFSFS